MAFDPNIMISVPRVRCFAFYVQPMLINVSGAIFTIPRESKSINKVVHLP